MAHGWMQWLAIGQLAIAGVAAMLAAQQAAVWRWEGNRSSARHVAVTAAIATVVLVSNTVLLLSGDATVRPVAFLVRAIALAGLTLSVLPLADVLSDYRPPRALTYVVMALVTLRLGLLLFTDLIYTHRFVDGLPQYGPLSTPTGGLLLFALFSYLLLIAAHGRSDRERTVLALGILGSLLAGGWSFATGDAFVGELVTGYLTLPSIVGITALIWIRQNHAQRQVSRFADRQHALANLSWVALSEPFDDLLDAARRVAARHLPPAALEAAMDVIARPTLAQEAPQSIATSPHDDEFVRAVANVVAASRHRVAVSAELERRANHDDLTGLPNRSHIRALIDETLTSDQAHAGLVVAVCNLDRFKTVNDAYGHAAGDLVLRHVADRLRETAWPCDQIARFGSDEFVVVCSDPTGADSVEALSDRIHTLFRYPMITDTVQVKVTASVGLVVSRPGDTGVDADTLLRDAATAAHDAKARGAATGRFHRELRSAVVYRADVEQRLVGAVGRGEIVVYYQPIVDLRSCAVTGFEALARWRRDGRVVAPAEWIPIAETTEIIHEIGEFVLRAAVRQAAEWHSVGNAVSMSVNVSARQLSAVRFESAIAASVDQIPASHLIVEVTESMVLEEAAQQALRTIRDRGVRVALDDFGTGYSALASVAGLPIDIIKIDQSITRRVDNPDGAALVRATTAIARELDLTVIAEGVETHEHHHAVRQLGCHHAQGFLYGRPVDAVTATDMLSTDTMRDRLAARRTLLPAPESRRITR